MDPRYSVKLSLLVEEFGLQKVYTPPNYESVRIMKPDLNRCFAGRTKNVETNYDTKRD